MKKLLPIIILSALAMQSFAQKETYDLATYTPPKGWKKEISPGSLTSYTITNDKNKTWCQIFITLSVDSKGGIKEDFESEWQELIVKNYKITGAPEETEVTTENGWSIKAGMGQFKFNNENALAILTTASGYKKAVSIVGVTNSQEHLQDIQSFLGSVEMKVPDTTSNVTIQTNVNGPSIVGVWSIGLSGTARSDDYKNPYAVNNYGFIKKQYTFNADGTYSFYSKTFKMVVEQILLVKETGKYSINGNLITIIPEKSVIEAWSKKDGTDNWGKLLTSQTRKLEKITYQFTKHYFSGIDQWNLVLQHSSPTDRDGPFSTNAAFNNSWLYGPVSKNNPLIDLPK